MKTAKRPFTLVMVGLATLLFLLSAASLSSSEEGSLINKAGQTVVVFERVNEWGTVGSVGMTFLAIACAVALWRYWRGDLKNSKRLLFGAGVLGLLPLVAPGVVALMAGALISRQK
ncbi:hypothetical protein GCM10010124_19740 [Pilimelia terevasa]|uniref:Uncharacterized protein n=1 Tax=Pilimelia terevasa TaxID=53372 RepID=A0A8J3BJP0_9ACTN|nr:hypothetical protein [Pilimelia terevasa]GGK27154.1 hypothetical protein GCM10010124_19740 [Pilimelia terevasa]